MSAGGVERSVRAYLRLADRFLPGRVRGFHIVGSAALGEYVPGRSDLDFVAVVDDAFTGPDLRRLRLVHKLAITRSAVAALAGRHSPASGTPNGVFVRESEMSRPVSQISPVASQTAQHFSAGEAFDVNPVVWKVLAERGLTFRGRSPDQLGLDAEPEILAGWNRANLADYWDPWGRRAAQADGHRLSVQRLAHGAAWVVAWGVLGPPRLHCTIATGQVIGKLSAGEYALETFGAEWHPVIGKGLAYWRGERVTAGLDDIRRAGEFVTIVVDAARDLQSSVGHPH